MFLDNPVLPVAPLHVYSSHVSSVWELAGPFVVRLNDLTTASIVRQMFVRLRCLDGLSNKSYI